MEFLYEYGLFFAKAITLLVSLAIVIGLIVSAGQKNKPSKSGSIEVTPLNKKYDDIKDDLKSAIYDEELLKQEAKAEKKQQKLDKKEQKKQAKNTEQSQRKRLYVLDFDGDMKASGVDSLREEISAILTLAKTTDEVVIRLESPGGMVHGYGLASSQLSRIKDRGIPLTICVDKVAASGGYMMACVGHKILAAPFAIIGSIGVVAQLPNFHRLLKKNDVDFELLTAGEYKRTLTMFGENTDKGRQKFVEDLDKTHALFKQFVSTQRPIVNIDEVATGEIWFGMESKENNLIDDISTSDDYILSHLEESDVYHIQYTVKKSLPEKLGVGVQSSVERAISSVVNRLQSSRFL